MGKKIIKAYIIFTLVFFIALFTIISLSLKNKFTINVLNAHNDFKNLKITISSLILTPAENPEEYLIDAVNSNKRLILVTIYYPSGTKIITKDTGFVKEPQLKGNTVLSQKKPVYTDFFLKTWPTIKFINQPLEAVNQNEKIYIDGIYTVLSPQDIFPELVSAFISITVFFIATIIILSLVSGDRALSGGAKGENKKAKKQKAPGIVKYRSPSGPSNLFSDESGLCWEDHLLPKLKFEIDKSASFDQDLVLVLITIDNLSQIKDDNILYSKIAQILLSNFKYKDLIFEYQNNGYALILPDTDLNSGIAVIKSFRDRIFTQQLKDHKLEISIGLCSRNGRLLGENIMYKEAQIALNKARSNPDIDLFAFKVDPEKYRDFISQKY